MLPKNQSFYFTFGCDSQLSKRYVKITARSELTARLIMCEHFGTKWSMVYDEHGWKSRDEKYETQADQFGYTLLVIFVATAYDYERAQRQSTWDRIR